MEIESCTDLVAVEQLRYPDPIPGRCEIDIRPFFEAAALAEFVTPE
ncbi:MAG: hypothetical protein KGI99_14095 [Bradyrhizobium sp.]|nr:hypothetical protein [Bradyrhizobium sp.]MBU6463114.1 hypothetical protein [Pseudomonadota bacterium]MDE2068314.1 hypothetical protein [Bradyrhizobium sp.]